MESPSHGKVPKWLEDMSSNIQQLQRLPLDSHSLHAPSVTTSPRLDEGPPKGGSARHGRRASASAGGSPACSPLSPHGKSRSDKTLAAEDHRRDKLRGMRAEWDKLTLQDFWDKPERSRWLHSMRAGKSAEEDRSERLRIARDSWASKSAEVDDRRLNSKESQKEKNQGSRAERSLEESWNSLRAFNKKHKGRLCSNAVSQVPGDPKGLQNDSPLGWPITNLDRNKERSNEAAGDARGMYHFYQARDFIIPELPTGQVLTLNILSTWGDRHYLGLNGIELFTSRGHPPQIARIWADPADINVLPEYTGDPRVVRNLVDGVYRTRDDLHLWLAPFTPGADHLIHIELATAYTLAMLRIWNYNKSRIHSYRGARDVEIFLDGLLVFRGEIARACGSIQGGTDAFGDTILFTTDEHILELISQYDTTFIEDASKLDQIVAVKQQYDRPLTADISDTMRPFTSTASSAMVESRLQEEEARARLPSSYQLDITLLSNWGHPTLIGLTGLEIVAASGAVIPVTPQDLHSDSNPTHLYRLLDGENWTVDANHMWSTLLADHRVVLSVRLESVQPVAAINVWNYNASQDLTCGVRDLQISLSGRVVGNVMTVRRAPGNLHYNFGQLLRFDENIDHTAGSLKRIEELLSPTVLLPGSIPLDDDYEHTGMPTGLIFTLLIFSTWGDPYYVGLNGLEMYDFEGHRIPLSEKNVAAHPDSVNILDSSGIDVRTPDKLVDGVNDTLDGRHMWLAPILPGERYSCVVHALQVNRVYIVFDEPTTVSMMKLWNYSKTASRGVKEFGILVDNLLVYNGVLDGADSKRSSVPYRSVIFSSDRELLAREAATQTRRSSSVSSRQRTTSSGQSYSADQSQRPHTSLQSQKKVRQNFYDMA